MRVVVMLYEYDFTHSYRPESVFFFWGDRKVVTRIRVAAKGGDWTGLDFHVVDAFCVAFV